MQLFRYAGWTPRNRPKNYKPKPEKPAPSRTSRQYIVPPSTVLVKFAPDQINELPPMSDLLREIMLEVCLRFRVIPNELVGTKRNKILILARGAFIKRVRNETSASFPRIARALNRDHTTIIHSYYDGKHKRKGKTNDASSEVSHDRAPCNAP